jgi:hypothetical protein
MGGAHAGAAISRWNRRRQAKGGFLSPNFSDGFRFFLPSSAAISSSRLALKHDNQSQCELLGRISRYIFFFVLKRPKTKLNFPKKGEPGGIGSSLEGIDGLKRL